LSLPTDDPSAGSITLDGTPLGDLNLRSLHRHTGLVAQDTQLFGTTVEENITYGLEPDEYSPAELEEAARRKSHDRCWHLGCILPRVPGKSCEQEPTPWISSARSAWG
jgi:ABC-type Fe3+/spermidine/putrescine transport system ATPase subunit